ncbi:hypothetical protein ACHAWF_002407 [Thalassiosira exigua]
MSSSSRSRFRRRGRKKLSPLPLPPRSPPPSVDSTVGGGEGLSASLSASFPSFSSRMSAPLSAAQSSSDPQCPATAPPLVLPVPGTQPPHKYTIEMTHRKEAVSPCPTSPARLRSASVIIFVIAFGSIMATRTAMNQCQLFQEETSLSFFSNQRDQRNAVTPYSTRAIHSLATCRTPPPKITPRKWGMGYSAARFRDIHVQFAHVPKAGSDTLRDYITRVLNGTGLSGSMKDKGRKSFRVAFVRDPMERFVSAYMETRLRGYKPTFQNVQEDFDEFFQKYLDGNYSDGRYDIFAHFMAQKHYLSHKNGDGVNFDYIGRIETIHEEWNTTFRESLRDSLPLSLPDFPLKRKRHSFDKAKPTLTPQQAHAICDLYCHDYCCLSIDFPKECPESSCPCPAEGRKRPFYPWLTFHGAETLYLP